MLEIRIPVNNLEEREYALRGGGGCRVFEMHRVRMLCYSVCHVGSSGNNRKILEVE